jgi:dTDP-4-dehydrorhamnose reductase
LKILLTGRNGQVGWELERTLAPLGEVTAVDIEELDLRNPEAIRETVRRLAPQVIINPAAFTAVDQAERDVDLAFAVNATAPAVLAEEAKRSGALLVHYSTDYVFSGTKPSPYVEEDVPDPVNVYGHSKLAGERAVRETGCRHVVLRTSWVYGGRGRNFLLTVLRLAGERPELRIVVDQIGAPTWCRALAEVTSAIVPRALNDESAHGLYHATNAGETSWFGFATEILRIAGVATPVHAISTSEFPTTAARPANSRLDNSKLRQVFGVALPEWRSSLSDCMRELGHAV